MGKINAFLKNVMVFLIRGYQLCVSPLLKPCCRYYPSCSQYTLTALQKRGIASGLWMGFKRILRCNPWSPGGYDPVPPPNENH